MRWNCPHCRVSLEASDDQISSHWAFSLCPKCSRFGLIRDFNPGFSIVKVDRAPAGEKFIRASEATDKTPVVKPAQPRSTPPQFKLPEPLPEVPEKRGAILPKLVLVGCLGMLLWNGYRYLSMSDDPETAPMKEVSDQVVAQAMAPVRIEPGSQIQARSDAMQIRNGPGLQFPVIGVLDPRHKYSILSAQDPWYQIEAETQTPAWVMSDEIIPAN